MAPEGLPDPLRVALAITGILGWILNSCRAVSGGLELLGGSFDKRYPVPVRGDRL
jgi:hypothetical protein